MFRAAAALSGVCGPDFFPASEVSRPCGVLPARRPARRIRKSLQKGGSFLASLYETPVTALRGVGEKRAGLFRKLGAPTVGDLLRCYPRAWEDLSCPGTIRTAPPDQPFAIRATVTRAPSAVRVHGGSTLYRAFADDGETVFPITFFNNPYVVNLLREGEEYIFYGRVHFSFQKRELLSPEFYPTAACPPIRLVYRQTQGLNSRAIGQAVKQALLLLPQTVRDPIPDDLRAARGLCSLTRALHDIHFPPTAQALETARTRLIFEELLVLQTGILLLGSRKRTQTGCVAASDRTEEFWQLLPFAPTNAQRRAVREAAADMASGFPMNRLVQGDVGSGKTAVAAALCWQAAKNGMQAALMAPTELLARQHFATLSSFFRDTDVRPVLLTGSTPKKERTAILEALADGSASIAVGTHALLSEGVTFSRLGLAVTDEQHRFGVAQRSALAGKGDSPHLLVMSATPIPRTLALMIYGDLDLSILDELPPGRTPVLTYAITSDKRPRALNFLRRHAAEGRQSYIICPMIDEGGDDRASVTQYAARLREEDLPGLRIGELHGRMKSAEKDAVMSRFAAGELDVLVSTTVVEVGVDVPNAAVMMIENAERYGLSQLHQLRGRVGRGSQQSYCILVTDAQNQEALSRMKVLCSTTDGFRVADEDLRLRGPGDFFGSRQHGLPELQIADFSQDLSVLQEAQEAARAILASDPDLSAPAHRGLRGAVHLLFSQSEAT